MFSWKVRNILTVTVAVAAVSGLAAPRRLAAATPDTGAGANITFTATGIFGSTPLSGADTLLLRGQQFTITVVGNSSLVPTTHGRNWAIFTDLVMNGTVYSGLIPNQPYPISSTTAAIDQTVGASEDIFQSGFPATVADIPLTIRAYFILPGGTLSKPFLRPFASVPLGPNPAGTCTEVPTPPTCTYVTYSNVTATTALTVQIGTLVATLPAGDERGAVATPSFVLLAGAQAVKPRWLSTRLL